MLVPKYILLLCLNFLGCPSVLASGHTSWSIPSLSIPWLHRGVLQDWGAAERNTEGCVTFLLLPLLQLVNWVSDGRQFFVHVPFLFPSLSAAFSKSSPQPCWNFFFLHPLPSHPGAICGSSSSPSLTLVQILAFHKQSFKDSCQDFEDLGYPCWDSLRHVAGGACPLEVP